MKTKEELNAMKEEVETVGRKLSALTEEELEQASGGTYFPAVSVTPFGETTTAVICPHCMKAVKGTVEQINAHIAACRG